MNNSGITELGTRSIAGETACASLVDGSFDTEWDEFLWSHPLGQFQQTSVWGRVKASEGWETYRVVVRQSSEIVGGFQILYRTRGPFREGLLNKGPVYVGRDPALLTWLLELVERSLRVRRIHLLVAQAPDFDTDLSGPFIRAGYLSNGIAPLITATLCVPLGRPGEIATSRVRKSVRVDVRRAIQRGVTVREGSEVDIPTFFRLMSATCERQNSHPNPATAERLLQLYSAFSEKKTTRLTVAEWQGRPLAMLLSIRFGRRVTQWKKGWSGEFPEKHPTTLLSYESIEWAEREGASLVDFVGCDRHYAETLLSGSSLSSQQQASRYFFLSGFGAEPVLLPEPMVLLVNPNLRFGYRFALPLLRRFFLR